MGEMGWNGVEPPPPRESKNCVGESKDSLLKERKFVVVGEGTEEIPRG